MGISAPYADPTNTNRTTHRGIGAWTSQSDYEAEEILKKQCLEEIAKERTQATLCFMENFLQERLNYTPSQARSQTTNEYIQSLSDIYTNDYLNDYLRTIIVSEIKSINGKEPKLPKNCDVENDFFEDAPHLLKREAARSLDSIMSASIVYDWSDGFIKRLVFSEGSRGYRERIERSYPFLFNPENVIDDVMDEVNDLAGDLATDSVFDIFYHRDTVAAANSAMIRDPNKRRKFQRKIDSILKKYARQQKRKLKKLCDGLSPDEIMREYPAIFNQAIIDMSPDTQRFARISLCRSKSYYDPEEEDFDCDGIADSEDSDADNPFEPEGEFDYENSLEDDPPFSSSGEYTAKIDNKAKKINLSMELELDMDSLSSEEKKDFLKHMRSCTDDLNKEMSDLFKSTVALENEAFKDYNLDLDIKIEEDTWDTVSDFTIHKCFCSTCSVVYNEGIVFDDYIPNDMCPEDMTPEMKAAADAAGGWYEQEDAGNLTVSTTCKTIKHEVLHQFGLPDEYVAGYYPFNRIGEHDSVMASGYNLKERHLRFLLSPKKCL